MNPKKKRVRVSDNSHTCVSSSFLIKLWSGSFPVLYVNNSLWCSG
jgi:hypothetical protein